MTPAEGDIARGVAGPTRGGDWRGAASLYLGNCLEVLPQIPAQSVNAVVCDPPYPGISRPYGRMTEAEWHEMMRAVVGECRRVLKPTGSAVFILQPNSERVGRMRAWLWEFMAWTAREWNQVQDAWWWNYTAPPVAGATTHGLLRGSLKACVWLGPIDCYREQSAVLWTESEYNLTARLSGRCDHNATPSGYKTDDLRCRAAAAERGGVTPFNVLPIPNGSGREGHSAVTPHDLADWWVRYISPPGGTVLDPFAGVGTIPLAALTRGRRAIAIERDPGYFATMERRVERPHLVVPRRRADEVAGFPLLDGLGVAP